ncbi:LOW QUALITY PROTEIN: spatacsin [Thalassophryne amazonica]|uniref:LOW QUALITY PROTEIN: spatacsin n=1 Tax=Thalassophryne amazonica TaxID=390379 RepID=UPI001472445A|nr:LOW QUALITY PROTEIN: spatacsin [Thalassophryne amazonica]
MLDSDSSSMEVAVIPENQQCGRLADVLKAEFAPGGSLLACLELRGRLEVWDPADREAAPATADGYYGDFFWEEVGAHEWRVSSSFRLLAVGSQCHLKLLEAEQSASISLVCVAECGAERLLEAVREQDPCVCELQSVQVLYFAAGRCCALLNCVWLLQLQWSQSGEEPLILCCCKIQLTDNSIHTAVHHSVGTETLFILSSTGLISVCNMTDGSLLASVDLLTYLSSDLTDEEVAPSSSSPPSFCVLQVSPDLSTAVAITEDHGAIAVDLNHYFRIHPDHLLCAVPTPPLPLCPPNPKDQDSLSSSNYSLAALGHTFCTDRSWESRLASIYSKAQKSVAPSASSVKPSRTSWVSSLAHLESHQALTSAHSKAPPFGAHVTFSVPELSRPCLLAVSEFSALLTFISPGNKQTTVAFWDLESGNVSYHQTVGEAVPIQRCGERHHRLLLKKTGVFQVLFSVSQQDLVSRLMLFGSAAVVDAICHLNSWGRCSIPIHALQAGLKNRQLDTVDFYLKSKENILSPSASFSNMDQPVFTELNLKGYETEGVRNCVDVLDRYVTELRSYMKRFPWPAGGGVSNTDATAPAQEAVQEEWEQLPMEEVVRQSILTNQIPRAQAALRKRGRPEQRLSALRMEGLRQVFSCLQSRNLHTASTLLTNMGFNVNKELDNICVYTDDKDLREFVWSQSGEEPLILCCCKIQLTDNSIHTAVHHSVGTETLFILSSTGLICIFHQPCNCCRSFSWESRLASIYSKAQKSVAPSASSVKPSRTSWVSSLAHLESHQALTSAHSRAPPFGAHVTFSVPELSRPCLLAVSEFSALLTFISPGNKQTTVAFWDLESGNVSYHQTVLFSVSQQDLVSRLMLFGSAAVVDAICHLNSWGRCSIPIHALQAGLKNRQLDTVDFYLKSKENILSPSASFSNMDQPVFTELNLKGVQELCPALNLLCSAVRDSNSDVQSRQFSEQLLNITLNFVNTQIRSVLSNTQYPDETEGVRNCVDVLDRYVTELRSYMKRFPWPAGGGVSNTDATAPAQEAVQEEWEQLPMESSGSLRKRGRPEQRLSALRMEGLRQVFSCLQSRNLHTASTLLTNMGFNVNKELDNICVYTDDKDLREFVVEELSRRSRLPEEELQSVEFIRAMERLGSLPASRCSANTTPRSILQIIGCEVGGSEVLEELLEQMRSQEAAEELWKNVRVDWIRNWDQSSQTAILLSRLQHTELNSCDSSVLWHYLTALHDQCRVIDWIQNSQTSRWPELTPELVNNNTVCSTYMRENILDLLARSGIFIQGELEDLKQLLWRLAQGQGLMASPLPIPHYRSPLGLDLHSLFITFCLDHNLHYLLYTYLNYYRLTPRNCPILTNKSLFESHPWFEMLVKIQEITRNPSDPVLVFQASLTSAQVLLPGGQASLSSLLLEGHSLLALATIMFAPGGVDQVVVQGERSCRSERAIDPQLLKMALAPYPKLRAALFPTGSRGNSLSSDISVYHLLQSLHPLDVSRLFGWQAANTLNSTEMSEVPDFSSPQLVKKFALVENLDYLYYLRHSRPSFAYATFLVQHLSGSSDIKLLLEQAWQQVYKLSLQCFNVTSVAAAAVCFCELLGIASFKMRVDIRVLNTILQHWVLNTTHRTPEQHLCTLGLQLAEAEPGAAEELIGYLEAAVTDSVEQRGICRSSYEAAQEWALPVHFCQLHSLKLSSIYPAHCASDGQFIHFLLFVQMHSFPPQQVRSLVAQFSPTLEAHLSLAFQDLQVYNQSRSCGSAEETVSVNIVEEPGFLEHPRELFLVLLQSQEEAAPCRYLLQEAIVQHCSTLAVLAACQQGVEVIQCLCVWVLTSVDDVTAREATSHLHEASQHHEWTLHDLSIIWKTLLGRGCIRPLLRGFKLFQRDCPLVLVLRMFELCCDYRNFTEAKAKLLDFQRTLITLRSSTSASPGGLPLQWMESQASVLLLTMLQRCSSQYDLHRLLQLLADVDKHLKSNGPDFRKLSQVSQLLQGSEVSLSPKLLQCTSPSEQQEELQAMVDALQAKGCYSQARQVALLAGLPVHRLLLSQLSQEAATQKAKHQWRRLEARVNFWKKCHEQLKADGTDPESASQFFMSQSEGATSHSSDQVLSELLDVQEKCLLLMIAAHWFSLLSPDPVDKLESLEKQLWVSRVRQHILTVAMENESVFNLPPPPAVTPETSTYEVLMKQFSFSTISALNMEKFLSLEGLPGPTQKEELNCDSELSPQERNVLSVLVGQLLDEGSIHEASRICRYFSLYHPDVWFVLRCRGLASGELDPDSQEESSDVPPKRSFHTFASLSSLSSFMMFNLPEDQVSLQLQVLVDQCRHGNNYCKQVLSLYQLSKELQCSFSQICEEEPCSVLEKLLLSDQPDHFRKARACIQAQGLSADTVAELVSSSVVQVLLTSTQELQPERQAFRALEGKESLVQLIKVCDDPNLVGVKLMENITTVPLRDLSCIVEMLIVAHDCFSLTCNMEGIVRVLQAARHLSHAHLAPGEHYNLLVRLLTGIGRYNEMTYVFDLLHQNHRFEMLLRKKVETERGQSSSLKTALLDYIKRCLPADSEKHNMVALCFSMRREIGENHEIAARTQLKLIESQPWVVTPDLKASLLKVLALLKDAAESFSKDSCVRQASRCVRTAKLVHLQIHFLNQGSELRLVNLRPAELLNAVMELPRCYQVFVVSDAYGYTADWAEILYHKVILNGDFVYLEELKRRHPLTSSLFEDIFQKLADAPGSIIANVKRLLSYCDDVCTRFKLAYQQNLHDVTTSLLQDPKTSSFLRDRLPS